MIMGHKSNTHLFTESNSVNYCRKLLIEIFECIYYQGKCLIFSKQILLSKIERKGYQC